MSVCTEEAECVCGEQSSEAVEEVYEEECESRPVVVEQVSVVHANHDAGHGAAAGWRGE